jgi:hypothetical protein
LLLIRKNLSWKKLRQALQAPSPLVLQAGAARGAEIALQKGLEQDGRGHGWLLKFNKNCQFLGENETNLKFNTIPMSTMNDSSVSL